MLSRLAAVVCVAAIACGTAAAAVPTDARGYCDVASALLKTDPAAAKAALAKAALLDAHNSCISDVQGKLAPAPSPAWDKRVEDVIARWTTFAGAVAGAALALIFILALAFGLATHSRRVRRVLRGIPLVRRLMQPRISLGTFTTGGGLADPGQVGIQALVDNALQRLTTADKAVRLGRSSGTDSVSDTIARLGDLAPQFKAVAAIVAFVVRVARLPIYTVNGTLQPNGETGLGLTLTLDRGRHAADATTLWREPGEDKPEAVFQQIATVAAGWIDYAARKDEGLAFDFVASPRSIGFFRAGVVMQELGRVDEACDLYDEALRIDGTNVGALVNLARIYESKTLLREQAVTMLEAALEAVVPTDHEPPDGVTHARYMLNPVWYQAMYSLSAHYTNAAVRTHAPADATQARKLALELADTAALTLNRIGYRSGRRLGWLPRRLTVHRHRDLAKLLFDNVEPGAITLIATFAPPASTPEAEPLMNDGSRRALRTLLRSAGGSGPDAGPAARALVEGYVLRRKRLSPRARFNVTCYYATAPHRDFARALKQLATAIDDAPVDPPQKDRRLLAGFVWHDESLEHLRVAHHADLELLTAPYYALDSIAALFPQEP